MTNEDWDKVVAGIRVKMKYFDSFATGCVTIKKEDEAKVLFDGDFDLAYWYYKKDELELE